MVGGPILGALTALMVHWARRIRVRLARSAFIRSLRSKLSGWVLFDIRTSVLAIVLQAVVGLACFSADPGDVSAATAHDHQLAMALVLLLAPTQLGLLWLSSTLDNWLDVASVGVLSIIAACLVTSVAVRQGTAASITAAVALWPLSALGCAVGRRLVTTMGFQSFYQLGGERSHQWLYTCQLALRSCLQLELLCATASVALVIAAHAWVALAGGDFPGSDSGTIKWIAVLIGCVALRASPRRPRGVRCAAPSEPCTSPDQPAATLDRPPPPQPRLRPHPWPHRWRAGSASTASWPARYRTGSAAWPPDTSRRCSPSQRWRSSLRSPLSARAMTTCCPPRCRPASRAQPSLPLSRLRCWRQVTGTASLRPRSTCAVSRRRSSCGSIVGATSCPRRSRSSRSCQKSSKARRRRPLHHAIMRMACAFCSLCMCVCYVRVHVRCVRARV